MKLPSDVFNINRDLFNIIKDVYKQEVVTLVVINTTFTAAALFDQFHVVCSRHLFLYKSNSWINSFCARLSYLSFNAWWYIDKSLKSDVVDILYERSPGPVVAAVSGACVLIYASVRHSPGHVHRSGDPGHRRGSRSYGNLSDSLQSSTTRSQVRPIVDVVVPQID